MELFRRKGQPNEREALLWRVVKEIEDRLMDCEGVAGCDLALHLFSNGDPLIIYTADAERETEALGVWDSVKLVQDYEKSQFNEIFTPCTPFNVANMVLMVVGEYLFRQSKTVEETWGDDLNTKQLQTIGHELEEYFSGLTDLYDLFDKCCDFWAIEASIDFRTFR